jgi:hypothetical protein
VGENGYDGPAKGEEGHEKAKQFKEDRRKWGEIKEKSREKEGIILFIGTTPFFF